jgi:hypothetical protein
LVPNSALGDLGDWKELLAAMLAAAFSWYPRSLFIVLSLVDKLPLVDEVMVS